MREDGGMPKKLGLRNLGRGGRELAFIDKTLHVLYVGDQPHHPPSVSVSSTLAPAVATFSALLPLKDFELVPLAAKALVDSGRPSKVIDKISRPDAVCLYISALLFHYLFTSPIYSRKTGIP